MTTVVKAQSSADFLSLVPRMLGFVPRESIVLVPFRRGRSRGALRLDLPRDDAPIDEIAATMLGLVCRIPEADGCAIVIYAESDLPSPTLIERIEQRADACGVRVVVTLWVHGDRWGSYAQPGAVRAVASTDDLPGVPALAAGDQASGADLPPASAELRTTVAQAIEALREAIDLLRAKTPSIAGAERIDPRALAAACFLQDVPSFFDRLLSAEPDTLDPFEIATAAWALGRPSLRDIALICWLDGLDAGDVAAEAQLAWEGGDDYPAEIAMRMWGEGPQPAPDRLARALALVRTIASLAPDESRPGPMAVCGWLSWALGSSTHAGIYATKAIEIEPEHGLSEIVLSFVQAGHLPDWAFQVGNATEGVETGRTDTDDDPAAA
ncbi:hypothetical protein GCM10009808_23960 [Microbacterium sediminicola]|uniref:Lipopolysaccharide biosynthesis protein n=1 Tax=Microbacterium sediminicola TaxID=415210 RepID=A0ABP4UJV3_9MICO